MPRHLFQIAVLTTVFAVSPSYAQHRVTVAAGGSDRRDSVVQFQLPEDTEPGGYALTEEGRQRTPLQVGPGGRATFILGELKAGQTRTYRVGEGGGAGWHKTPSVDMSRDGDRLTFTAAGKEILQYQGAKTPLPQGYEPAFQRGGYIYPLYSPAGKLVADDYPPKHKHHHGVWAPWTSTKFEGREPDFWNMGKKTGTVEFAGIDAAWGGRVAGGFVARHRMVDLSARPEPKTAIDETWTVRVYRPLSAVKATYVFDWMSTQTCASDSPLVLPKYHYGGFGYRGNREWEDKKNCIFLTSEGKDRGNGNETTGKWCWVGGKVEGDMTGVAILCHPENFRFPQPMRLNPDEPFFCYAPSQGGDWSIEPGKPYVARYRIVAMDGPPDAKEIERLWNDYANPPQVTVN
jgi:hypothetical protein